MPLSLPEYDALDATALGELVRKKDVSPAELVDAAIERIEARDGPLNAVVWRFYDRARKQAAGALPEGPFRGVPFLIKDLLAAYDDTPLSSGSRYFREYSPGRSSALVERYLATGVVVVGRTASPELGLLPVTETERFGATRNPWDTRLTPGGSSGGSAAAVAARYVPMAGGGDGGGSLRIPGSCCGLFALKPSRGRNPVGPWEAEQWEGFVAEHVLTRSVRDSAAMLDATSGRAVGEAYVAPAPSRPYSEEVGARPGKLRIAVTHELPLVEELHSDCRAAFDDAEKLLRELGHETVPVKLDFDAVQFRKATLTVLCATVASQIRDSERFVGRKAVREDFEAPTWIMKAIGEALSGADYSDAVRRLHRVGRSLQEALEPFDTLLTPTLALPPLPIGALVAKGTEAVGQRAVARLGLGGLVARLDVLDVIARRSFRFIPYTMPFNVSGQPSMNVPLYWNAANVPIGVMLTARYGDESTLFRLAAQLEQARPWAGRRPPPAV